MCGTEILQLYYEVKLLITTSISSLFGIFFKNRKKNATIKISILPSNKVGAKLFGLSCSIPSFCPCLKNKNTTFL